MREGALHIGVLYESDEWSDHKLADELARAFAEWLPDVTTEVHLINMEESDCVNEALTCDALVSRVFASAAFRSHEASLVHMEELLAALPETDILLINEPRAHAYEISKLSSSEALHDAGLHVPRIYQHALPAQFDPETLPYPCIIKPDCGGRTTDTAIVHNAEEAAEFLAILPAMQFLAQEYVAPERGFITRVEIAGGKVVLVVKRSIADNGLSAYRFGSTYELYSDLPMSIREDAERAAAVLGFTFGSFDIIETDHGAYFIDANSVSNVSEDCTELFDLDLMRLYADEIAELAANRCLAMRLKEGGSMLSIKEVYELFEQVGCCSFATLDGHGGVDSRIAHFFAYDDEGLYLRTMTGKPFYRQMVEGGKLSVCGEVTEAPCEWDDDNMPHFQPGFMVRVSGDVRELTPEETQAHIESDPRFAVADYDIKKYPETVVLVLHSAWGEVYNYDFNMVNMDHKILRERFAWGGATFVGPGFHITDDCIECGACANACTHKAIVPGTPYSIRGAWCDECGNCHNACPTGAVVEK